MDIKDCRYNIYENIMHASSYMYQKQHPGQLRGRGFRLADANTLHRHTHRHFRPHTTYRTSSKSRPDDGMTAARGTRRARYRSRRGLRRPRRPAIMQILRPRRPRANDGPCHLRPPPQHPAPVQDVHHPRKCTYTHIHT